MHTAFGWLRDVEAWLDARGKGAWIAAMVIGFIAFWPIGLALLIYMFWSNRMSCSARRWSYSGTRFRTSGNSAFDAYRDETLRRLEDEQSAFQEFLERLRKAKDQSEFDRFMEERARRRTERPAEGDSGDDAAPGGADPYPA